MNTLQEKGIGFHSLQDSIDTTTATGQLFFHITGAFAEFERNLIREQQRQALNRQERGRIKGGRKWSLRQDQICMMKTLHDAKQLQVQEICDQFKISRRTFYRSISSP